MSTSLEHAEPVVEPAGNPRSARRMLPVVVGVVLAPVLLVLGGIAFTTGSAPPPAAPAPEVGVGQALVAGDQAAVVGALQARVERLPADDAAWASLGIAYLAQARTTADPTFYDRAEAALAQ